MPSNSSNASASPGGRFATTHWSLVLAAGQSEADQAGPALEALCAAYWYPIYAHVRRAGYDPPTAQDLTQGFFARLLERRVLPRADPQRGKFRGFLLASLRNFLLNEYDRNSAQKRGGGRRVLSIDFDSAEQRYAAEPVDELTADRVFERQWALTVLEQSLAALQRQFAQDGKAQVFEVLAGFLTGDRPTGEYRQAAGDLEMSEAAVKMAVSRLRRRYRDLIREEITRSLADPADVDDELRSLFAALGS
jgi:DNA-directed RNA polymerase specialized sigma24 family protein